MDQESWEVKKQAEYADREMAKLKREEEPEHVKSLREEINKEVTKMFESVLDYAEVAVSDNYQYRKLRAKILRVGNNCIRRLNRFIDEQQ